MGGFIDGAFPPLPPALGDVEWRRVGDMLAGLDEAAAARVLYDTSGGASQGAVRDCWLVGALVTLGIRRPALAEGMVAFPAGAPGRCDVRLFQAGAAVTVSIDDRLPYRNGEPLFAKPHGGGGWWLPLVEKAYAKLHGGYGGLAGGLEADAFHDLTGWGAELSELGGCTWERFWALYQSGVVGLSRFAAAAPPTAAGGAGATADKEVIRATVAVGDGGDKLSLCFTVHDDAEKVAEAFLEEHRLGACKAAAVAEFVRGHQRAALGVSDASPHTSRPDTIDEIVPSHSYTVVGADPASRRVLLANPWGGGVPTFAAPPPEGAAAPPAGAFWLAYDVVCAQFDALHTAVPGRAVHRAVVPKCAAAAELLAIPAAGRYLLSLHAADHRRAAAPAAPYAPIGFRAAPYSPTEDGANHYSPIVPARQVALQCTMSAGDHYVMVTHGVEAADYTLLVYALD